MEARRAWIVAAAVVAAGCGRSRSVVVEFINPALNAFVERVEVEIAPAPNLECDGAVWLEGLPAALAPRLAFTLGREDDSASPLGDDARFPAGSSVVALARGFDDACDAVVAGCTAAVAGAEGPLEIVLDGSPEGHILPCVGACDEGACRPLSCAGSDGTCADGNALDGDGCSAACEVEPGFRCDGAGCEPYVSCLQYLDDGWLTSGLYPRGDGELMLCDMHTEPGGWTLVARGYGDSLAPVFIGWSTSGPWGEPSPYQGGEFTYEFKRSDARVAEAQGAAPQVLIRRLGEAGFVDRFTAVGCRYAHTAPAEGPCATLSSSPAVPGTPPAGPRPDALGVGDAEVTTNDPSRGFRLPPFPGDAEGCDGFDDGCAMDVYVR